jgi:hypothetical protein
MRILVSNVAAAVSTMINPRRRSDAARARAIRRE